MKGKRIAAGLLAVLLIGLSVPMYAVAALSEEEINVPAAVLMEAQTGKVLYEKNPHEKRPCASITKVMTLLLVMEALDAGKISLTDTVTASAHASSMGGSDIWLKEGETMSVDDMIKATVVASANDAAVALAEFVAGSEDEFLRQMNDKAQALGMADTTFKNCNGLDEEGHLTSAYDVAVMSRELIKHQKIFDYTQIWIDYVRGGQTQLVNTNKLIKTYKGITGLKTGTTGQAGSCISATAERDGVKLIAVVLGAADTKTRFSTAATLLDYGFANWSVASPQVPEKALAPVPVLNGMTDQVEATVTADGVMLIPKGKDADIQYQVTVGENLTAPVEEGQVLGKVTCSLDGEVLKEYNILAKTSVPQITFSSVFQLLFRQLVSM